MSDHGQQTPAPRVAIQFQDLANQEHAAHFGMWLFLGSELLLFTGLFGLYTAYRTRYAAEFAEAVHHNALWIGTTNVVILIVSSFTVAWAVHSLRRGRRGVTLWSLAITLICGLLFLLFKGIEYGMHFREGVFPGHYYAYKEMPAHGAQLFFTLYYFMTGLHALHMDKTESQVMAEREHPGSGARYVFALIALLCLTGLTFGLHFVTVGELGIVVALTIAAIKVAIVALVFMELRESMVATRAVAAVAVVFVVLLCLGMFGDVGFR